MRGGSLTSSATRAYSITIMSIFTFIKSHAVAVSAVAVVAVAGAGIAGRVASNKAATAAPAAPAKNIALVDVASFRNGTTTISVEGTVESRSQADLKAQVSAPIAAIDAEIGDTVVAGQTILELQNADIRAQLDAARGAFTIAQGAYGSNRQSAIDKVKSAYLAGDSAVHAQIDQLIVSSQGTPTLYAYYVTDPQLGQAIRDTRTDLTSRFTHWKATVDALSATSSDNAIRGAISESQSDLDIIQSLLDDIAKTLSDASSIVLPSSLPAVNTLLATVGTARTSVSGAQSGLTTALTTLEGAQTPTGSAAQAAVGIAESNMRNLEAQLRKTIVTAPFSGRISALPLHVGEFATPGTLLVTIVGEDGLTVKAYASSEDLPRIRAGAAAVIQDSVHGTVSNVSPSLSSSNKQAEIDIDVSDAARSSLAIGQNVSATISALPRSGSTVYQVPIQDVKIVPGGAYVYTVDDSSKAVQHAVTLGTVNGGFVQVTGGLDDSMRIIAPVYEIDDGQTVTIQ